jgi:hypothetical protein
VPRNYRYLDIGFVSAGSGQCVDVEEYEAGRHEGKSVSSTLHRIQKVTSLPKRIIEPNATLYPVPVVLITTGADQPNVMIYNRIALCSAARGHLYPPWTLFRLFISAYAVLPMAEIRRLTLEV